MREPRLLWPQQKASESTRKAQGNEHGTMTRLRRGSEYQNDNNCHHSRHHKDDDAVMESLENARNCVTYAIYIILLSRLCTNSFVFVLYNIFYYCKIVVYSVLGYSQGRSCKEEEHVKVQAGGNSQVQKGRVLESVGREPMWQEMRKSYY